MFRKPIIKLSLLLVIVVSCGKSTVPTKTVDTGKLSTYDEDISMVRPKYEAKPEIILEQNKVNPAPKATDTAQPPHANQQIQEAIDAIAEKNKAVAQTQGYRIQVFSGNNRNEYEQARGYILQHFPTLETYVSYSQPTYRLKVGDFLTKADAEKYLSSLVGRFVGAKVIYDNIDYKKGLLIK